MLTGLGDEREDDVEEAGMTQLARQPGCLRSWPAGVSAASEGGRGSFSQGRSLSCQSSVSKGTSLSSVSSCPGKSRRGGAGRGELRELPPQAVTSTHMSSNCDLSNELSYHCFFSPPSNDTRRQ